MASIAMNPALRRTLGLWDSTVGKKAVMAVTGFVLVGFVLGHMLGNFQIYDGLESPHAGYEKLGNYAKALRYEPILLWAARLILVGSVAAHIVAAVQLAQRNQKARPQGYVVKKSTTSTYASRTMYWSGPIVLAFIVYHILHLTLGMGGTPYAGHEGVYNNVVYGFQNPLVSGFYILSMILLCLHLYHGVWSMFQSLGINRRKWDGGLKLLAKAFAIVIALGNISIPISILTGLIKPYTGA